MLIVGSRPPQELGPSLCGGFNSQIRGTHASTSGN